MPVFITDERTGCILGVTSELLLGPPCPERGRVVPVRSESRQSRNTTNEVSSAPSRRPRWGFRPASGAQPPTWDQSAPSQPQNAVTSLGLPPRREPQRCPYTLLRKPSGRGCETCPTQRVAPGWVASLCPARLLYKSFA